LRRHKTWVHEGGISTPLIVHWPQGVKDRGELRHTPTHLVDIVPTLLELAQTNKPAQFAGLPVPPAPGRSLLPVFAKDRPGLHDSIWWEHEGNQALRAGDWKIVKEKKGSWELYNLKKDRGESHNLAAAEPKKLQELQALWERELAEIKTLATSDNPPAAAGRPKKR
jgi:arylsulfatase